MAKNHGHNLRKGRVSTAGQIYLVTTVTHQRQPLFNNFNNARFVIKSLRHVEHARHLQSLCFVIVPDHLHRLLSLGSASDLSRVVADVKRRSSYRINEQSKTLALQYGNQDFMITRFEKTMKLKV